MLREAARDAGSSKPNPVGFNPGVMVDVADLAVQLQHL